MDIKTYFEKVRKSLDYTREEFASKLNVDNWVVCALEAGMPPDDKIRKAFWKSPYYPLVMPAPLWDEWLLLSLIHTYGTCGFPNLESDSDGAMEFLDRIFDILSSEGQETARVISTIPEENTVFVVGKTIVLDQDHMEEYYEEIRHEYDY